MPNLLISPKYPWLAPLSGFSDLPFRLLCRKLGCDIAVTEMISGKGLFYNFKDTIKYIRTTPQDSPLVVQLFGEEPQILKNAILFLKDRGYKYFDLNAGCPVKKVTKTGAGASLLKNLDRLKKILEHMADAAQSKNIGIKIRLGWDRANPVYLKVGAMAKELGLGWITLHPRFAKQGFSGKAEWDHIKKLKEYTQMPVIASGDLFTAMDAVNCIKQTGADSIMFARGALKDPLIFTKYKEILGLQRQETALDYKKLKIKMIKEHIKLIQTHNTHSNPILRLRGILAKYIRGFPNSKSLREKAVRVNSWEDIKHIVQLLEEGT